MNKRSARNIILGTSLFLTACSVSLIAGIHIYGNHSLGEDGSTFQSLMSVGITLVTCAATLLLGVIICNCHDLLGSHYGRIAMGAGVLLLICETATFCWLRAGLEHSMVQRDETGKAGAREQAWLDIESRLMASVDAARAESPEVVAIRGQIEDTRAQIARTIRDAADLDNDGNGSNDGKIPGLIAESESLKSDLANREARLGVALDKGAERVGLALSALSAHQATRATALEGIAEAKADQHQFVQWAADLRGMFPQLPANWSLQIILGLVAISLMVPQYAGLAGISAALKIEVEPLPVAAAEPIEEPIAEPEPFKVVPFEPAHTADGRQELRKMVRVLKQAGIVEGVTGSAISKMGVDKLRNILAEAQASEKFALLARRTAQFAA